MAIAIRPSDGNRLTRADRLELDPSIFQAAMESLDSGKAMEAIFATEKEARAVATKLRARVNDDGRGLRAKVAQEGDEWVLEFKVSATKRDVTGTSKE